MLHQKHCFELVCTTQHTGQINCSYSCAIPIIHSRRSEQFGLHAYLDIPDNWMILISRVLKYCAQLEVKKQTFDVVCMIACTRKNRSSVGTTYSSIHPTSKHSFRSVCRVKTTWRMNNYEKHSSQIVSYLNSKHFQLWTWSKIYHKQMIIRNNLFRYYSQLSANLRNCLHDEQTNEKWIIIRKILSEYSSNS